MEKLYYGLECYELFYSFTHLIKHCEHKYDAIREKTKVCKCPGFTSQLLIYLVCGRLAFKSRSSYLDCDPTGPLPITYLSRWLCVRTFKPLNTLRFRPGGITKLSCGEILKTHVCSEEDHYYRNTDIEKLQRADYKSLPSAAKPSHPKTNYLLAPWLRGTPSEPLPPLKSLPGYGHSLSFSTHTLCL